MAAQEKKYFNFGTTAAEVRDFVSDINNFLKANDWEYCRLTMYIERNQIGVLLVGMPGITYRLSFVGIGYSIEGDRKPADITTKINTEIPAATKLVHSEHFVKTENGEFFGFLVYNNPA